MPKRNVFFTIEKLKAQGKKTERTATLQPRFVTGSIWFPDDEPDWIIELEKELLAFSIDARMTIHDDLIDTLAYTIQVAKAPVKKNVNLKNVPKAGRM